MADDDQEAVERIEHELHRRLQAQRRLPFVHLLLERIAGVAVLALGVGEQLDGQDVGVAVDDAPDQHRARLGGLGRALLDARHEVEERADVGAQPHEQRHQQAPVGGREDDGRADPLHGRVPDGIDHLHDRIRAAPAPVCMTLLATRPAKSFWKKPRLWRST